MSHSKVAALVAKYTVALGIKAVLAHTANGLVVDRIGFDGKHRKSPRNRYQILDSNENVVGFGRTVSDAIELLESIDLMAAAA